MPHNVTVAERTPDSVLIMTDGPRRTGGQPVTSWMLKYEEVNGNAQKTFFFSKGEAGCRGQTRLPVRVRSFAESSIIFFQCVSVCVCVPCIDWHAGQDVSVRVGAFATLRACLCLCGHTVHC